MLLSSLLLFSSATPIERHSTPINATLSAELVKTAKIASVAYCHTDTIEKKTCKACQSPEFRGLQQVKISENKFEEIKWFTAYNPTDHTIVVAYRGSWTINNWLDNFKWLPMHSMDSLLTGPKVERGWYRSIKNSKNSLKIDIERLKVQYPTANYLFTGHSSGASYPTLAAYVGLRKDGFLTELGIVPSQVSVITFGGPRVGNQAFVDEFKKMGIRSFRVAKADDMISQGPPSIFGFRHVDQEVFINEQDDALTCSHGSCGQRAKFTKMLTTSPVKHEAKHIHYMGVTFGDQGC